MTKDEYQYKLISLMLAIAKNDSWQDTQTQEWLESSGVLTDPYDLTDEMQKSVIQNMQNLLELSISSPKFYKTRAMDKGILRLPHGKIMLSNSEIVNKDEYFTASRLSYPYYTIDKQGEDITDGITFTTLEEYMNHEGELDTDLPDGDYEVMAFTTNAIQANATIGFSRTKIIEDDPNSNDYCYSVSHLKATVKDNRISGLAAAAEDAHARSGYWGEYYEGSSFDKDVNGFKVDVGS